MANQPDDANYDESKVPAYELPELLPADLSNEESLALWRTSRRDELVQLFGEHVYGKTPSEAVDIQAELIESGEACAGKAIRRQVLLTITRTAATGTQPYTLVVPVLVYTPKETKGPVPAFVGLNFFGNQCVQPDPAIKISTQWMRNNSNKGVVEHRATEASRGVNQHRWPVELLIEHGYGLVTAYYGDFDPDTYTGDFSDGAHPLFYQPGQTEPAADEWGAIGAWAWGLSQIRRWLETEDLIDSQRLAAIGHSRLGKAALWAGAQDEKFAMVVSNDSGCGGAALFRRCFGERIHHMQRSFACWFAGSHAQYAQRESALPVDQHMLLALIAPRPLYVASAAEDLWADPKGEFLAAHHASPVYELFGTVGLPVREMPQVSEPVHGRIGYHVRSGPHDITTVDWKQFLKFAELHLNSP